ncbi:U3-containing 90S pre-ribosomal complex subunit-domain containing protein, partial [Collybia nuda]
IMQQGDDLEDDFVIDDDLVALSGEEDAGLEGGFFSDDEKEGAVSGDEDVAQSPADDAVTMKRRKRREKEKERKVRKRKLVQSVDVVEHSITAQPPGTLSDYLSSIQAKCFSKLSPIELDDMRIPETSIADTTAWTGPRTLDQLVEFIIKVIPTLHIRLSQKSKNNGSPTLLFITGAALRVADVTRVLKEKKLRGEKGGEVAKLFAKHFKLVEHVAYLKRTKVGAAVGTPGRVGKLLCDTDALTVSALSHIILDVTYQDSKKRSLLDIPETRDEVFKTVLGGPQVQKAIKEGKIQVVLF